MTSKCALKALLLLQLCTGGSSIQAPRNVSIESRNLRSVLRWSPAEPDGNGPVCYLVQYLVRYVTSEAGKWQNVSGCAPTALVRCDVSHQARPYVDVTLRVRTQAGNRSSSWSLSEPFNAHLQSQLGPPSIALSTENPNALALVVEPDARLKKHYGDQLKYRVFVGQENEKLTNSQDYSSTAIFLPLKGGSQYCVQVHYVLGQRLGHGTNRTCATVRRSEEERIIQAVLLSGFLVALFGGLVLGFIFCVYKNYNSIKSILRPTLPFLDFDEFTSENHFTQLNSSPSTEETADNISAIFTDPDIVENVNVVSPVQS